MSGPAPDARSCDPRRRCWEAIGEAGRHGDVEGLRLAARDLFGLAGGDPDGLAWRSDLPPDRPLAQDDPPAVRYRHKEIVVLPPDFAFRYGHHDYRLLTACHARLGRRVLHLGCNSGINSVILARNGLDVHGVDVQPEAIRAALALRDREPDDVRRRLTFQCAAFNTMTLPAGSFDAAIAFDVFEHVYEEDLAVVLAAVEAALRPGGFLLAHMPRLDSYADPSHVTRWDLATARDRFGSRFSVLRCHITEENDVVPGSQRVNVLAQKAPGTPAYADSPALQALASRVPLFSSRHFNQHYTAARAADRLAALARAATAAAPFSMIRLGDMEARLLAFGRIQVGLPDEAEEGREIETHLGVNPARLSAGALRALQDEFFAACASADILGTHRRTINHEWSRNADTVLRHLGVAATYLPNEVDVCFNAELLDQGWLLPLLSRGRILLVGNAAPRFADLLADADYRRTFAHVGMPDAPPIVAGAVHVPHEGSAAGDRMEDLWREIAGHDFDTALVSASLVGKVLAGRIRNQLGALALDIGWNMQFLAGVSSPVAPADDMAYARKRRGYARLFEGRTGSLEGT